MQTQKLDASCYSSTLIIKYAREKDFDIVQLFKGIEDKRNLLENRHEWIDIETWNTLAKNFETLGGDLFKAGVDITESQISHFQLLFLKVASLKFIIYKFAEQFEKSITSIIALRLEPKKNGLFDIVFTPKDRSKYSTQICDFNRGCSYATGCLKQYKDLKLQEITCAARSDAPECRYRITWTPDPPILERFKNFILFRFTSQKSILAHMEETYNHLQEQYQEIAGIKDFYSHIMTSMTEGILWLDSDGKISFVNKGFCGITRRDNPDEIMGKDFREFLADDSMTVMIAEIFLSCRSKPQIPETFELTYRTATSDERIGQTTCIWVDSTQQQKPGFLLSIRDITDKRTIERKLYAVENRYRSLYENSPAIIVGIDNEGFILYANPAMIEQSGYDEKKLTNMHFAQLVAPQGSSVDGKAILAERIGKVGLQELHYRTKSGEWKSVALATFPLFGDKWEVIGLGAIGVDVTETKRLNEILIQTQRMDLLGQMAGGLAHDFKNLLSVISGYGKLITEISSETKIQEFAQNILLANNRANNLTKNLLTFSRGEDVKNEPFVLNEVVEEVKKLLPAILGRTIMLNMELPDERFCVMGDGGKIHQCLLNLCINARDAMKQKNGGKLFLRLKQDANPLWVVIEVEDTGPGIPPDIISRIFDPFFTTKEKGEGTGLGLSVVYGIVKSHGGDITVDSRPSEGATFTIRLPLLKQEQPSGKVPGQTTGSTSRSVIIVVDNDVVARNYCAEILIRQGYTVMQFSTIEETAMWLDKHPEVNAIALIPAAYAVKALAMIGSSGRISPVWISDTTLPPGPYPALKRPFPPAALIETLREYEIRRNGR